MKALSRMLVVLIMPASAAAQEPPPRPGTPHPLPPGIYEISAIHSNLCLTYQPGGGPRVPHVSQTPCEGGPRDLFLSPQRVHVVPARGGGYFIQVNTNSQCATVARGVVFGPASIDVVPCDTPPQDACTANAADQIFKIVFIQGGPRGGSGPTGDVYEVRTANNECWDIQAGKSASGVDVIRWACTGKTNQRFRFQFIAGFDGGPSLTCARQAGW